MSDAALLPVMLVLALATSALPAAPAKPRSGGAARETILPEGTRHQAAQAASPATPAAEIPALVARWEAAWTRAGQLGLLKSPEGREALEHSRRKALAKAFLDSRPGHPGMTEEQVRTSFLAQGEERHVAHVLCKTEDEAAAALRRLQAGEAFDKVAAEVSTDPSASQNKGDLGWIRKKEMVAAFGDPVFAAPVGGLVGPLKSEFGWHVAKVWEARSPRPEDFPAVKDSLMKQAAATQEAMKRQAALEGLRTRYPLRPDMEVLGADRTTEVLPGDEAKVAGRVAGVAISLRELKLHLIDILRTMGQSHSLGASTKSSFMQDIADQIRLAAAAKTQGLDRRPAVRAALWAAQRQEAYALFSKAFLATAPVGDEQLRAHYEAHPDRFKRVGALRLQVLVAETEDRVSDALAQVRFGLPWREAVARYGNPETTGNPEPGWVEVGSLQTLVPPSLLQPMLGGPLDKPVGPMLGPDGYMIFNVLERRPGPVLPLADCRDAVRADYLKDHGAGLVDRTLDGPAR